MTKISRCPFVGVSLESLSAHVGELSLQRGSSQCNPNMYLGGGAGGSCEQILRNPPSGREGKRSQLKQLPQVGSMQQFWLAHSLTARGPLDMVSKLHC